MARTIVKITGDGVVVTRPTGATPLYLKSVTLTPAAAVSSLTIDDSADGSGTDLLTLQAAANGASVQWVAGGAGVPFFTAIYADIGGASASATIEYDSSP